MIVLDYSNVVGRAYCWRAGPHRPAQYADARWLGTPLYGGTSEAPAAGIQTLADEQAGTRRYAELRLTWDRHITPLAPEMAYSMDEINPALTGLC